MCVYLQPEDIYILNDVPAIPQLMFLKNAISFLSKFWYIKLVYKEGSMQAKYQNQAQKPRSWFLCAVCKVSGSDVVWVTTLKYCISLYTDEKWQEIYNWEGFSFYGLVVTFELFCVLYCFTCDVKVLLSLKLICCKHFSK